jgi:cell division protein FtsQ
MDRGGRILGSVSERFIASLTRAFPRPAGAYAGSSAFVSRPRAPEPHRSTRGLEAQNVNLFALPRKAPPPGVGFLALTLLLAGAGGLGLVHNGAYAAWVARVGTPQDALARAAGFPVDSVTISGETRLREDEILAATGVDARSSLPFLDAADVRRRLMEIPLVKSARVLKLYPNRLVVAIEEREPAALWQFAGKIKVVSADGKVIDDLSDERFLGLPFVVGDGADKRLPEFVALRREMGDLAQRVKSGILVAGRRWSLAMTNGVEVKLPEREPVAAIETLLRLQREARILDKDIVSIDLRLQDRVAVRLTEQGVETRAALAPKKPVKSGAHT